MQHVSDHYWCEIQKLNWIQSQPFTVCSVLHLITQQITVILEQSKRHQIHFLVFHWLNWKWWGSFYASQFCSLSPTQLLALKMFAVCQKRSVRADSQSLANPLSSPGTIRLSLSPGNACSKAAMKIKSTGCGSEVEKRNLFGYTGPPFPKREPILRGSFVTIPKSP